MNRNKTDELKPEELRSECNLSKFDFKTTGDLPIDHEIIGQDRALKAVDFGLKIKSEGFNLYVCGLVGTGRNTTILQAVEKIAQSESAPEDLCYLYNFQNKDEPKALKLRPGLGYELKKDTEEFIRDLEEQITKAFVSEEYERRKKSIIGKFEEKKAGFHSELEGFAQSKGFTIQQTLTGFAVVPVYKGKIVTDEEYEKLPKEKKEKIKKDQQEIYDKLESAARKISEFQRDIKTEIKQLDEKIGLYAIGHLIDELKKKYGSYQLVVEHLDDIQEDVLKNIEEIRRETDTPSPTFLFERPAKEKILNKYRINLLVDNCNTKRAPVIVEQNPTYYNLIGYIEYRAQFGVLSTDFTMIKPGSVHKANGGYLIIQAEQLLRDYFAWDSLKKIIRYKKVKIEDAYVRYGFAPTTGLKPEPISIDIKVIIVGNPWIYRLMYIYDEEFKKIFKIKADFDSSLKKNEELIWKYIRFVAIKAKEENLMPFEKSAVAKIIDYGSRLTAHKEKLSARFLEIADLMREADSWARREAAKAVSAAHIHKALEEKIYRSNMIEEKIQELIEENTILIDTQGKETGQINGISVIDLGDYMFGMPSRITVKTFVGKGNIINIEREAKMSGKIHSKGILILSGYLGEKFAQDKPLALQASICFEQSYEEVEGDSASSAELYCLLSSLSGFPLRQDIAVTGSVDQRGKIQPVGGINQKIEGFFEVCKIKGLTGTQGVIIPRSNVKNLMLKEEVVQAVKNKKFYIYPVETIDQGIEILTRNDAGALQPDGNYPPGSVNYKINERLEEFAHLAANFGKKQST